MRIKLLSILVLTVISIMFSGCGSTVPKPFSVKQQKKHHSITEEEKNKLLFKSMKQLHTFKFHNTKYVSGITDEYSRLYGKTLSYYGLNTTFKHKFNINHTTDTLTRVDVSQGHHAKGSKGEDAYGMLTDDKGFSKYVNNFQIKLADTFQNELDEYSLFKQDYLVHKEKREIKLKKISTQFKDSTKILSKKLLEKLSKHRLSSPQVSTPIELYTRRHGNVVNEFLITNKIITDTVDRYKVNFTNYTIVNNYKDFPKNVVFNINNVEYNYLPTKYIAQDKNINVEVMNSSFERNSIKQIKITNKTKEFIEIDTIAGYYGEDVTDNIINIEDPKRVKISPRSYKIFKTETPNYKFIVNDFPTKKLLKVNIKNQKVNYGFSVGYKMINQNVIKNLYKVNKYSISNF